MEFKHLGKPTNQPSKEIDIFPKPENINYVKFETNELTSYCPVTGQPDFSTAVIEYNPDKWCIESKSLKLYIWSFRDEHIFAEGLANIILNDIVKKIDPVWCKVTIIQNIRGGLQLTTVAEKIKEKNS